MLTAVRAEDTSTALSLIAAKARVNYTDEVFRDRVRVSCGLGLELILMFRDRDRARAGCCIYFDCPIGGILFAG